MAAIIITALLLAVIGFGFTVAFGQSVAPYSTCIKSTDHGYDIILEQNNKCSSKQFSETVLYYQANGYHAVEDSKMEDIQIHLTR